MAKTKPKPPTPRPLTAKQEAWWLAYLANSFNQTAAAITAGYSKKTARTKGSQLAHHPIIVARIRKHLREMGAKADTVLYRWLQLAFYLDAADFQDFLTGKTSLKELRRQGVDTRFIKSVSLRTFPTGGSLRRIEFLDSLSALTMLTKILGLDRQEREGGGPVIVQQQVVNVSLEKTLVALHERITTLRERGPNPPTGMDKPNDPP